MAAKKPVYPEPYCMSCYSRFSRKKMPYMVSCCHLYCSTCLFSVLGPQCNICATSQSSQPQNITEFAPAYDVWDLIETRRHNISPPIRWLTVKKTNVVCLSLVAGSCTSDSCHFSHDKVLIDDFNEFRKRLNIANPPALTSAGWLCRCDLEHDYGAACEYCGQKLDLS